MPNETASDQINAARRQQAALATHGQTSRRRDPAEEEVIDRSFFFVFLSRAGFVKLTSNEL